MNSTAGSSGLLRIVRADAHRKIQGGIQVIRARRQNLVNSQLGETPANSESPHGYTETVAFTEYSNAFFLSFREFRDTKYGTIAL